MDRMRKDHATGRFVAHDTPNHCALKGCDRPVRGRGLCNTHYLRLVRHGDPTWQTKAANGEGGIGLNGYRYITVNGTRVLEHRHVMARHLGRVLRRDELVHHVDGNKLHNAIENLTLVSRKNHPAHHPSVLASLTLGPRSRWRTTR